MTSRAINNDLHSLGVTPKKSRGQNFLENPSALSQIIEFAELTPDSCVLEIGGGLGALTELIAQTAPHFISVEVQPQLASHLKARFGDKVHQADIRDIRPGELFPDRDDLVVMGNVPYSISTDIVLWVLENRELISRAVLLFQQEFAERIAAAPGSRDYGSLSVLRTLYSDAKLGPIFPGELFTPPTKVSSRLVELRLREEPAVEIDDVALLEKVVRQAFSKRRKTLLNSLSPSELFPEKEETERMLVELGIDPKRRAETLTLEEFARLAISRF